MEQIKCPDGIEYCYVPGSDGKTKACIMWDPEENMCSLDVTLLYNARQYLEDTSDGPEEMRLAGVRAAVEKILEYLENMEAEK